jgi:hypothetical protein
MEARVGANPGDGEENCAFIRLANRRTATGGREVVPVTTYSISRRAAVREAEELAAQVEIAPETPVTATAGERVRVAIYVFFGLAAAAFLVATLVLALG